MPLLGRTGPRLLVPLFAAIVFAPPTAAAQVGPAGPDGIARTEDDLGTWDAVLVGRGPNGRVVTATGVEINTRGCDGTCIVTTLKGDLAPRNGGSPAWWRDYDSPAGALDARTGLAGAAYVRHETSPAEALTGTPRGALPRNIPITGQAGSRTSVEYPSEGRRIVTIYVQQPDGSERLAARITYTRRK
jgi:hypothetical protein